MGVPGLEMSIMHVQGVYTVWHLRGALVGSKHVCVCGGGPACANFSNLGVSVREEHDSYLWSPICLCAGWHQSFIHVCGFIMDGLTYPAESDCQKKRKMTRKQSLNSAAILQPQGPFASLAPFYPIPHTPPPAPPLYLFLLPP